MDATIDAGGAGLRDVVVIGGGIAGLTAAWRLRHRDVLLLEAEEQVGGRMRSEPHGEYWLNYGAHLLPAPGSLVDGLVGELGLESVRVWGSMMGLAVGDARLLSGPVETYPFRLPIPWRDRVAFAAAGIRLQRSVRERRRVVAARPGEQRHQTRVRVHGFEDQRTFRELLGPLPATVEQIFSCASHRATAELDELSAGCGVGLFSLVWGGKDSLIARNLVGGTGRLPAELADRLGSRVRASSPVTGLREAPPGVVIDYRSPEGPRSVPARHVVLAAPAPVASRLVRGIAPEAGESLRQMNYGAFVSVALATNETEPMPWDRIYAMATPGRAFDMFTNQAHALRSRPGPRRPGGSLMLFAGGHGARDLLALPDDVIVDRFLADLSGLFPAADRVVETARVKRWPFGNVFASPGRRFLQAPIEGALGVGGNLHLAGDYFAELGNLESAAQSGAEAAARIDALLAAAPPAIPTTSMEMT